MINESTSFSSYLIQKKQNLVWGVETLLAEKVAENVLEITEHNVEQKQ